MTLEGTLLIESDLITPEDRKRFFQFLDSLPNFSLTLKGNQSLEEIVSKERDRFP